MANMLEVEIYSRPGCHLCDEAKAIIEGVRRRFSFNLNAVSYTHLTLPTILRV